MSNNDLEYICEQLFGEYIRIDKVCRINKKLLAKIKCTQEFIPVSEYLKMTKLYTGEVGMYNGIRIIDKELEE